MRASDQIRGSFPFVMSLLVRGAVVLALLAAMTISSSPQSGAQASTAYDAVVDLTFPVAGRVSYTNDYAGCRGGTGCPRRHKATDIMAPYGAPVHAAVGGTISFITGLDGPVPSYGYMISIAGDDGRTYNYIHLGRQDAGPQEAYASGMKRGVRVQRGQRIGNNGCSGNASCSAPHLHFEIVDRTITDPYGTDRMNPYRSLQAAQARGDLPGSVTPAVASCAQKGYALAGDWDKEGKDGVGWWCDGKTRLRSASGQVHEFTYGRPGDVPIVADWNGDGRDTISVIRDGTWHVNNRLGAGSAQHSFTYGRVSRGDVPIAGTWDGGTKDMPGIIRDTQWHLRNSQSGGNATWAFVYGRLSGGDLPLWGDWNDDGRVTVGIVRDGVWHLRNSNTAGPAHIAYKYGRVLAGDRPVVGDWNGNGQDTPGIVRDGVWHLRHVHSSGGADVAITFHAPS